MSNLYYDDVRFLRYAQNLTEDNAEEFYSYMENLEQYAQLRRFRFGEEFEFWVEYDEEIENARLPSLLIQPLVENALRHGGIEHFYGNDVIVVSAHRMGENIVISVEDNGVGMSREKIREVLSSETDDSETHIGIKNINSCAAFVFQKYPDFPA